MPISGPTPDLLNLSLWGESRNKCVKQANPSSPAPFPILSKTKLENHWPRGSRELWFWRGKTTKGLGEAWSDTRGEVTVGVRHIDPRRELGFREVPQ